MQSTITLEKAKELVADAVQRFPNRINPRNDQGWISSCLYTGPRDTHCIAGQVMADLGLPLPEIGSVNNSDSFDRDLPGVDGAFTDEAIEYLRTAQYVFDGGPIAHFPKTKTRRWASALNILNRYEEEARTSAT